jgi:hypothetical protein
VTVLEETSQAETSWYRSPSRLLLAGLALGVAFDVLFNGHSLGISALIFAVLLLAGLALVLRWEKSRLLGANLWLPATLLFFAAMTAVRANSLLLFLNVVACLGLLGLMAVYLTQRSAAGTGLVGLIVSPLQSVAGALGCGGQVSSHVARHDLAPLQGPARRQAVPVLRGVVLAFPVILVFAALLASADLIFADRLEQVLSPEIIRIAGRWIGHISVAAIVGLFLAGGLAYAVRERKPDWVDSLTAARIPHFPSIVESAVVINAVNVLFFLFVLIQIPYLFGGRVNIVPGKFTYAEYARRGFGELIFVAVLVLGLLVVLQALAPQQSRRQELVFKLSATVLLALTGVLLASAFKRLLLYEEAYGFTLMRIYPHVFMVWLGLLLAWFAGTLWLRRNWLAIGVTVAALGFVATLNLMNPDALAVRQNVRRSLEPATAGISRQIDTTFFAELSDDAVPELVVAAGATDGKTREAIEKDLQNRLKELHQSALQSSWTSYNLARDRAHRLLAERHPESQ